MSAQGLPAHILALFTPRPPPQHLPPLVKKKIIKMHGAADFVDFLPAETPPERDEWETPLQRKARRQREKLERHREELKEAAANYDPHKDENAVGDPFKTLFVARISYDTTEKKLKREFEVFGVIKKARMVYDQKGKPRGYAFIEYEHERDVKNAYKQGDGKKIDGRRVMVDVERGRTVEGWLPRRLGGGRGPGRQGKPSKKKAKLLALQEKAKDKEKEDRGKDKEKDDKKDKDRDRDREKDRDADRDRDRGDRKKEEEPPAKGKEKEKKDKEKEKEPPAKAKDKDRGKEKENGKEKEKDRKRDRSRSRDGDRKAKKARD
mmetsp:Transcript_48652/g.126885  ORF Transcript_48652/g.126885 Transcript_48652/m.126885 type:complete len:320 (+) Transcript_48652:98-1057(+)